MSRVFTVRVEYMAYESYNIDAIDEDDAKRIVLSQSVDPDTYDTGDFVVTSISMEGEDDDN